MRNSGIDEIGFWMIADHCSMPHRGRADVRFSGGIEEPSDSLHRSPVFFIVFIENKITDVNEIKELRPFPLYLPCICNEKFHLQSVTC